MKKKPIIPSLQSIKKVGEIFDQIVSDMESGKVMETVDLYRIVNKSNKLEILDYPNQLDIGFKDEVGDNEELKLLLERVKEHYKNNPPGHIELWDKRLQLLLSDGITAQDLAKCEALIKKRFSYLYAIRNPIVGIINIKNIDDTEEGIAE